MLHPRMCLFGLHQGWLYLRGQPHRPVPLVRARMYRYGRHPMMVGLLLGIRATPDMDPGHSGAMLVGFLA